MLAVGTLETLAKQMGFSRRHIMSIYHTHEATCAKGFIAKQPEPRIVRTFKGPGAKGSFLSRVFAFCLFFICLRFYLSLKGMFRFCANFVFRRKLKSLWKVLPWKLVRKE